MPPRSPFRNPANRQQRQQPISSLEQLWREAEARLGVWWSRYEVEVPRPRGKPYRIDVVWDANKYGLPDGSIIHIPVRTAIELDGHVWHSGAVKEYHDAARDEYIESKGYRLLRVWGYLPKGSLAKGGQYEGKIDAAIEPDKALKLMLEKAQEHVE